MSDSAAEHPINYLTHPYYPFNDIARVVLILRTFDTDLKTDIESINEMCDAAGDDELMMIDKELRAMSTELLSVTQHLKALNTQLVFRMSLVENKMLEKVKEMGEV